MVASFDAHEEISGAQVVLTDRVTHVMGTVTDERGGPVVSAVVVVVFAEDASRWTPRSRYERTATSHDAGAWQIDGLPPGDYMAAAVKREPGVDLDLQDTELLERLRQLAVKFSLREDESRQVLVRLFDVAP